MADSVYGGPWQEFRALVATKLLGLALSVHFPATMDFARDVVAVDAIISGKRVQEDDR